MNRLMNALLYICIIISMLGLASAVRAAEVQQPAPPRMHWLSDGTKCVVWNGQLECEFKQGELVRELKYLYGYIGSLQAELTKRKYLNS